MIIIIIIHILMMKCMRFLFLERKKLTFPAIFRCFYSCLSYSTRLQRNNGDGTKGKLKLELNYCAVAVTVAGVPALSTP